MPVLGIDPDLRGGVAVVDRAAPRLRMIYPMPVLGVGKDRRVDVLALSRLVRLGVRERGATRAVVEAQLVKPQVSAKGPAMMGGVHRVHQNYGAVRAVLELELEHEDRVLAAWPSSWKRELGLTYDKALSRAEARRLFPEHAHLFSLVKSTGLAEAALLAYYGLHYG